MLRQGRERGNVEGREGTNHRARAPAGAQSIFDTYQGFRDAPPLATFCWPCRADRAKLFNLALMRGRPWERFHAAPEGYAGWGKW